MARFTAFALGMALAVCAPSIAIAQQAPRDTHEVLNATLWVQTAAEYRVDSMAKYRGARATLDAALADPHWTAAIEQTGDLTALRQSAIILDLDETVLDNSRFQAEEALQRTVYTPALWSQWTRMADAGAVPGALAFIHYAESRGVTVFFVTNRTSAEEADTRTNLARLGITLPADKDTVLTKGEKPAWTSDKASRRAEIAGSYRILMLVGDDLGDFMSGVKDKPENRVRLADQYADRFGERWVLLANPGYGSWETSLNDTGTTDDAAILQQKFGKLRGFK